MAGFGNKTAPDYTTDSSSHPHLTSQHSSTRFGLADTPSQPTYGAGFGNKRATSTSESLSPSTSTSAADTPASPGAGAEEISRFDTQQTHGSAPYSNAHTYGSASTAGAGWGNKTGSFGGGEGVGDSKVGKAVQRIGGMVHSPGLVRKGGEMREEGLRGDGRDRDVPAAN